MSSRAEDCLKDFISKNGAIPLSEFWQIALSHPEFGYYAVRDPFGTSGDFVTAPEVSQMFGEIIGAWVVDIWGQLGEPPCFDLIECGPGRGTLMADIMRISEKRSTFKDVAHIRFIETSPKLKQMQKQAVKGAKATWHDKIEDISSNDPCIIIGNEFLDALPTEQAMRGADGWQQRFVTYKDGRFEYIWQKADEAILMHLPSKTVSGEVYEVSPARENFLKSCMERVKANNGIILFIDYGYEQSHYGDTVQAVRGHKYANVLDGVGDNDITSHVDFDSLKRCAEDFDFKTSSCVVQGRFLMNLGIEYRAQALKNTALKSMGADKAKEVHLNIDEALRRLVGKDQMGELFKVMCFYFDENLKPAGF